MQDASQVYEKYRGKIIYTVSNMACIEAKSGQVRKGDAVTCHWIDTGVQLNASYYAWFEGKVVGYFMGTRFVLLQGKPGLQRYNDISWYANNPLVAMPDVIGSTQDVYLAASIGVTVSDCPWSTPKPNERYPHSCPACKQPAYVGFNMISCTGIGCRNFSLR